MTAPQDPTYLDEAAEQAVEELAGRISRQMDEHLHGMKSLLRRLEALPAEVGQLKDEMVTAVLVHQRSEALARQIDGATRGLARSAQVVELQEALGTVQLQLHQIAGSMTEARSLLQRLGAQGEERERALRESHRVLTDRLQALETGAYALGGSLEEMRKDFGDQLRSLPRTDETGAVRRLAEQISQRQERLTLILWSVVALQLVAVAVGILLAR